MSDVATYQNWINPGFVHLDDHWEEGETWTDVREGFLSAIGVTASELGAPAFRVLAILVERLDAMPEAHRRYSLLAAGERAALVGAAFNSWQAEAAESEAEEAEASEGAAETDPRYVEGHGWMRYDAESGAWVPLEGAQEESESVEAEVSEPGAPQWVDGHGWMSYDSATGAWVAAQAPHGAEEPHAAEAPPEAPPMPGAGASAHESESAEHESVDERSAAHGEVPPEAAPPAPLTDLSAEDQQDIVTAVEDAIAPVMENVLAELDADPDIDLSALSPEDVQAALAEVLADPALSS